MNYVNTSTTPSLESRKVVQLEIDRLWSAALNMLPVILIRIIVRGQRISLFKFVKLFDPKSRLCIGHSSPGFDGLSNETP